MKVAIAERKKMNRTQRYLARKVKSGRKDYEKDWQVSWNRYQVAKKAAQEIIKKKIAKWEEEQAKILNRLPQGERKKEGWKRLRRNLGGDKSCQEVKLVVNRRESSDEKVIVKDYVEKLYYAKKSCDIQ